MSKTPRYGFGSSPVLLYGSDNPVVMEPVFSQWHAIISYNNNATVTTGSGWVKVDIAPTLFDPASAIVDLQIFVTAATKTNIAYVLSKGGYAARSEGSVTPIVNGTGLTGSGALSTAGTYSGNLSVPYYRYRLRCIINVYPDGSYSGGWGRFDFTLS